MSNLYIDEFQIIHYNYNIIIGKIRWPYRTDCRLVYSEWKWNHAGLCFFFSRRQCDFQFEGLLCNVSDGKIRSFYWLGSLNHLAITSSSANFDNNFIFKINNKIMIIKTIHIAGKITNYEKQMIHLGYSGNVRPCSYFCHVRAA